jgi:NADPH:quinone reductase-like Zn-dependent oxidoreductase
MIGVNRKHDKGVIMKAGVIERLGASPGATSYPDPTPSTDTEVLVKVEATALNAVDLHIASGHHRAGAPSLPYVPGIEVVGQIIAGPDLAGPSGLADLGS